MARDVQKPADRARGLLLGLVLGRAVGAQASEASGGPAPGPGPLAEALETDEVARALLLGEELLEDPVDLQRLATRWVAWHQRHPGTVRPGMTAALDHLARYGVPLRDTDVPADASLLPICLPIALAAYRSPLRLVTGTYHTALLLHPAPLAAWAAVGANVAAAQFLQGRRDAMADVIEVLAVNDAPDEILSRVRRIPLLRLEDVLPLAADHDPVTCLEGALWASYHFPHPTAALDWVSGAGHPIPGAGAAVGALLGARDGEASLPAPWRQSLEGLSRVRGLAKRLLEPREPATGRRLP